MCKEPWCFSCDQTVLQRSSSYMDYPYLLFFIVIQNLLVSFGVPCERCCTLNSSILHLPQTDGQTEATNRSLEDLLQCCVCNYIANRDLFRPIAEFAFNQSFSKSKHKNLSFWMRYGHNQGNLLIWFTYHWMQVLELRQKTLLNINMKYMQRQQIASSNEGCWLKKKTCWL